MLYNIAMLVMGVCMVALPFVFFWGMNEYWKECSDNARLYLESFRRARERGDI